MDLDDGRSPQAVHSRRGRPTAAPAPLPPRLELMVEPLQLYERNGDGHTLARHCDLTPGADARRLATRPWLPSTGSFLSVAVAQLSTDACVQANQGAVGTWLRSDEQRLVIDHETGTIVGSVLRRSRWLAGETTPEPASRVLTVLRRNPDYASGFAVRTSYPVLSAPRLTRVPVEESSS